jgi:hypothetical protein
VESPVTGWVASLIDSEPLRHVFGDQKFGEAEVDLHELDVDVEGGLTLLRFNLAEFPDVPPARWLENGFNCVQLVIEISGISDLQVHGAATEMKVALSVVDVPRGLRFIARGEHLNLMAIAVSLRLVGLNAYRNALRE